jgi:hypothetical protein
MKPEYSRAGVELFTVGGQQVVHVPLGRGEELRLHLASHNIRALVSPAAETHFDRLEIPEPADLETLKAILDQWER